MFSIKDFFSKCDQIRSFLENFIFCAVYQQNYREAYQNPVQHLRRNVLQNR